MKAFGEWLRKKELGIYIQNNDDRQQLKRQYAESWRAALEWLYGQLDYSIEHKQIKDIIEQELGENQ